MVAENETTMIRIAQAGARKMEAQGYSYRPTEIDGWFTVTTPVKKETGLPMNYNVAIYPSHCTCDCKFYEENRHLPNTTCKHIVYVQWEEEYLARLDEEAEKYNDPDYLDWIRR